jgi:hypothetical protein
MTLADKFAAVWNTKECEEIADEFAIGFTEWFDDLDEDYCKDYTIKELLEIYKKKQNEGA